jgi:hypothetical protein
MALIAALSLPAAAQSCGEYALITNPELIGGVLEIFTLAQKGEHTPTLPDSGYLATVTDPVYQMEIGSVFATRAVGAVPGIFIVFRPAFDDPKSGPIPTYRYPLARLASGLGGAKFAWYQVVTEDYFPLPMHNGTLCEVPYIDLAPGGYVDGAGTTYSDYRLADYYPWYWDEARSRNPAWCSNLHSDFSYTFDGSMVLEDAPSPDHGIRLRFATYLALLNGDNTLRRFMPVCVTWERTATTVNVLSVSGATPPVEHWNPLLLNPGGMSFYDQDEIDPYEIFNSDFVQPDESLFDGSVLGVGLAGWMEPETQPEEGITKFVEPIFISTGDGVAAHFGFFREEPAAPFFHQVSIGQTITTPPEPFILEFRPEYLHPLGRGVLSVIMDGRLELTVPDLVTYPLPIRLVVDDADLLGRSDVLLEFSISETIGPADRPEGAFANIDYVRIVEIDSCFADFNEDGGVDGADVDAFFVAWVAGDPTADVNEDGGVDGSDVDAFFVAWVQAACE